MLFLPLRANGGGKRVSGGVVVLRFANSGTQRLQHLAIGFVFDAFRQRGGLNGSAIQNAFDGRGIGFAAQCGADACGNRCPRGGVLQTVRFRPLHADGGGERLGSGFVALCGTNSGA